MSGDDGSRQYAEARRRALARTGDPQKSQRGPGRPRDVADPALPCGCTAADPLPHNGWWHHLTEGGNRTYCTIATSAGRCPCESYEPAPAI